VTISSSPAWDAAREKICCVYKVAGVFGAGALGALAAITGLVWREPTVSTHPDVKSATVPATKRRVMALLRRKLNHTDNADGRNQFRATAKSNPIRGHLPPP
jgi:hypothetical protein